jgi:hypothetical protein
MFVESCFRIRQLPTNSSLVVLLDTFYNIYCNCIENFSVICVLTAKFVQVLVILLERHVLIFREFKYCRVSIYYLKLSAGITQNTEDKLIAYKASQLEAKTKIQNCCFVFLIKVPDIYRSLVCIF